MNLLEALINSFRLPELRNKILFTGGIGAGQAYGFTVLFQNTNPAILGTLDWFQRTQIILVLTAGTVMLMWFGELITEYGIGNGVSLIIFAGIIGRGPQGVASVFSAHSTGGGLADYVPFIIFGVIALVMTAVIIEVQQAVRKIPIQSAQRVAGGREVGRRASFLPLRVNHAGVIPIIFAISVMFLPTIIANYFNAAPPSTWYYRAAHWIQGNFAPDTSNLPMAITYNGLYFLFTFGFTYFYTAITFDVHEVADNLKRYSSFIPGIRPGRPTADYLQAVMNRVTFVGAIFLGFITVILPIATSKISGINQQQMYLGGTAILIVVGVALDTLRAEIQAGTELGRKAQPILAAGQYVSDGIMIDIVRHRLTQPDCSPGFIMDGFPRTVPQAEALDELMAELAKHFDRVIYLQV